MNIGLLIIATNKYKQFVPQLFEGVKKFFLAEHNITVFLFTDEIGEYEGNSRVAIVQHIIPAYKFPLATLYRYKVFYNHVWQLAAMDYLFYSDVDMRFESMVGNEILGNGLTFVYHPGYYSKKEVIGHWGSNGVVKESTAWIEPDLRFGYVAGGFNGGKMSVFMDMAKRLDEKITWDESLGVMAEYHDESHANAYLKNEYNGEVLYLDPSYCMVEQMELRRLWNIIDLPARIVALAKDHNSIRS